MSSPPHTHPAVKKKKIGGGGKSEAIKNAKVQVDPDKREKKSDGEKRRRRKMCNVTTFFSPSDTFSSIKCEKKEGRSFFFPVVGLILLLIFGRISTSQISTINAQPPLSPKKFFFLK